MPAPPRHGFTLIELSIVLVVIGLIVGGVLVGRDLIKAAELRSVITDIERFNTAANTFLGKYGCVPGDCANATSFFGAYSYGGYDCTYGPQIPAGHGTCNGNGNGQVVYNTTATGNSGGYDETTLFWQQLSLAGLIQGYYGGALDGGALGTVLTGTNVPATKLANGCYSVDYSSAAGQDFPNSPMNTNIFMLGNSNTYDGAGVVARSCGDGGLYSLPAASALKIDQKLDDGLPFSGTVQTPLLTQGGNYNYSGNASPGCTNENSGVPAIAAAVYATTASITACQLAFKSAF